MSVSRMPLSNISCILVVCLLFQICCTSTKTVPVYQDDYNRLEKKQVINVYLLDGSFYQLTEVQIKDGYITGIIRYEDRQVKIPVEDIKNITADKEVLTVIGALLIAAAIALLIIAIICATTSVPHSTQSGMQE